MSKQSNSKQEIEYLESRIKQAEQNGEPVDSYIKREISWLENQLENFLQKMKDDGQDIENNYEVAVIEIRQYATMRNLAKKIGLPEAPYDDKIKQIQIRIFGEENWENFFGASD